jgi:hypothetical protein
MRTSAISANLSEWTRVEGYMGDNGEVVAPYEWRTLPNIPLTPEAGGSSLAFQYRNVSA